MWAACFSVPPTVGLLSLQVACAARLTNECRALPPGQAEQSVSWGGMIVLFAGASLFLTVFLIALMVYQHRGDGHR